MDSFRALEPNFGPGFKDARNALRLAALTTLCYGQRITQRMKKPDLVRYQIGFQNQTLCFNDRALVLPLVIIVVFKFVVVIEVIIVDFIPLVVVEIFVDVVIL